MLVGKIAAQIPDRRVEQMDNDNIQTFSIGEEDFLLDGEPFRILAGSLHYFRIPRAYWKDRLLKMKACGFNTVDVPIAWNVHEKTEGEFDFSGENDVEAFLDLAAELGFYAIVRPGPYIGFEWEFGGFPWWLLKYDDVELRCMNDHFLECVDRYFDALIPKLAAHQLSKGGNIILVQVENEYGSYGDDAAYMEYIRDAIVNRGIDMPLFTSDGTEDHQLLNGGVDGALKAIVCGANAEKHFNSLREVQPEGPLLCSEFWNGWFTEWEYKHYQRDSKDAAIALSRLLKCGASVIVYMYHGGTNFGFMNGANYDYEYKSVTNSYDNDSPLSEGGEYTKKHKLFKELLGKYNDIPEDIEMEPQVTPVRYGKVQFTHFANLFDNISVLSEPVKIKKPVPMEKLDQGYGLILYRKNIKGPRDYMPLVIDEVHDRANIYLYNKHYATQSRNDAPSVVEVRVPEEGLDLAILVENMGRVSFGQKLRDQKGITNGVRLGQTFLYDWDVYPLPLDDLSGVEFTPAETFTYKLQPQFLKAQFVIEEDPCDTFVKLPGLTKGIIFINGKPLSRYWEKGPQQSAYLPACFLEKGINELVVLELDGYKTKTPYALLDKQYDLD